MVRQLESQLVQHQSLVAVRFGVAAEDDLPPELVDKGLVSNLLQPRHIHVLYAHRPASADEAGFEP